tara:strand:- start:80 stop:505 length:426 start_codon:yes stop_codon:yes gene_type:complete
MGRIRKGESIDCYKERRRIEEAKRRASRSPEKLRIDKEWRKDYYQRTKERQKESNKTYVNSIYYVYSHTNSKGDIYIGSGNRARPNNLRERESHWVDTFSNECIVKILSEFKNREDAYIEEDRIIKQIGLHNLINKKHVNK